MTSGMCPSSLQPGDRWSCGHPARVACASVYSAFSTRTVHSYRGSWFPTPWSGRPLVTHWLSGSPSIAVERRTSSTWKPPVSYTHLRAHETRHDLVCRLLLEKKKK